MSDEAQNEVDFAVIPVWLLYSDVSDQALRLYALLNRTASSGTVGSGAIPAAAHARHIAIGTDLGVTPWILDRALQELADAGAVTVRPGFDVTIHAIRQKRRRSTNRRGAE